MTTRSDRPSGLLHPIALAAIALLLVNDHVLKARYPGWLTGKLSDVAGLIFFPLLIRAILRTDRLAACVLGTGIGFAAVKLWAPANAVCAKVMGILQWPLTHTTDPVVIVRDPTDLLALPALALAWWIGQRASRTT